MGMSRAARATGRVVKFADTFQPSCGVDADDDEAAQVLSNLVLQCTHKNASTSTRNQDTFEAPQAAQCRRSSRLLQMFKNEELKASEASRNKVENPSAPQVSRP
jgi:hypothetical protein